MAEKELKPLEPIKLEENEVFKYPQVIKHTHNKIDSEAIDARNLENLKSAVDPLTETVASDTLVDSADTERSIPADSEYAKYKDIKYNEIGGTIRVYFEARNPNSWSNNIFLRIRVNGVEVGFEQEAGNDLYTEYSQDITVVTGDNVQLYAEARVDDPTGAGLLRNFRLKYNKQLIPTDGTVVQN